MPPASGSCCRSRRARTSRGTDRSRAAPPRLVAESLRGGAHDRASLLAALRERGPFDEHGDPVDPPVWLWRAAEDWTLEPERAL